MTSPPPPDAGPSRRRRVGVALLGGVIGFAFLVLALRGVDPAEVRDAIGRADPLLLVLASVLLVAPVPLLALRWMRIARATVGAPAVTFVELSFVGGAVNNCLPGRVGEVVKAIGLARRTGRSAFVALGTILTDRVSDVLFFAGCFALSAGPFLEERWARYVAVGGGLMVLVGSGLLVLAVRVARRHPGGVEPAGRFRARLMQVARGLASVHGAGVWTSVVVATLAAWGAWMIGMRLVAMSLDVSLSLPQVVFTAAVLGLGTAIPSLPGFVGTYHWLATTCLVAFGVDRATAVAFAVLLHALWFVPITIIGIPLMLRLGLRFSGIGLPAAGLTTGSRTPSGREALR